MILAGKGNRANVVMCSQEASAKHISVGMKLSEARAVAADLVHLEYNQSLYKQAQKQLCRELIGCSPKVSAVEPGVILLDASGLNLLGGESRFCMAVHKAAAQAGFGDAHIGLADSAFAAVVASKFRRRRHFIVEPGRDQQFLAELSTSHLPISAEMQESLDELGIRTIGQMASLSRHSLVERFAQEGAAAFELACGIDSRQPTLPAVEKEFKTFIDLGSAIELIQEIQFVLKAMIDRLCRQLKEEGFCAEELKVCFYNDDEVIEDRPIKLLQPSNHAKFLLEVIKLSLEAHPLQREVTAIRATVSQFGQESIRQLKTQTDNTSSDEEQPQESLPLTLMLQRFVSRLGDKSVVKAVANDQHIPELSAVWQPVVGCSEGLHVVPTNVAYAGAYASPTGLASGLALRTLPAPQPVLVQLKGDKPDAIAFGGSWHWVREITVPERLSGLWWEQSVKQSYYIALIEPKDTKGRARGERTDAQEGRTEYSGTGILVLLIHAHESNSWCISGVYD